MSTDPAYLALGIGFSEAAVLYAAVLGIKAIIFLLRSS